VTTFDKQRTLAQISRFDEILDVRSPAEYAEDHIPQAANFPVLDDDERAEVGTVYKQVSPFEARKRGAAKVAANIARHLQQHWQGRERDWRPLVYCWRGGTRSAATRPSGSLAGPANTLNSTPAISAVSSVNSSGIRKSGRSVP